MTLILTDEKQTHLAHVILQSLQKGAQSKIFGDSTIALREIKKVLSEQMKLEQEIDHVVCTRLHSYSRSIPEGSQEWQVMYQKTYSEELRKRGLR